MFVSDFTKFSNIQVLDRQNLEKVLLETESGIYKDADFLKLGEIKIGYAMTGSITKTSSGYALQMQVVPTSAGANAATKASYSATCTVAEMDDFGAIKKASSELLSQLGVNLTAAGRNELLGTAPQSNIYAQTALARGISAQRGGTEVAALSYYYQAAAIDPSLLEAANRASVLSANVTSGNIGSDARSDIQWRKEWIARLSASEEYFDGIFKKSSPPYTLFYSTGITQGKINYETETLPLSIEANLHDSWSPSAQKALQAMYDGLNATKRKDVWGLAQWPVKRVTELNPFSDNSKIYSITAELLNDKNKVIGRQTFNIKGEWSFNFSKGISIYSPQNVFATVTFSNVNANYITDRLTIRIASVNGIDAKTAAQRGIMQIQALPGSEWANYAGFGYNRAGYDRDGYNRGGYDRNGYNWDGYDKSGYNKDGYDRNGRDRNGYKKDGYNSDGYDKDGYNKSGYNKDGYDRNGRDLYGMTRWDKSWNNAMTRWDSNGKHGWGLGIAHVFNSHDYASDDVAVQGKLTFGRFGLWGETGGVHRADETQRSMTMYILGCNLNLFRYISVDAGLGATPETASTSSQFLIAAGFTGFVFNNWVTPFAHVIYAPQINEIFLTAGVGVGLFATSEKREQGKKQIYGLYGL